MTVHAAFGFAQYGKIEGTKYMSGRCGNSPGRDTRRVDPDVWAVYARPRCDGGALMPHKDPEARRAYARAYYSVYNSEPKNAERLREQGRARYAADPERHRAVTEKHRSTNRDKINAVRRERRLNDPAYAEKLRAEQATRRQAARDAGIVLPGEDAATRRAYNQAYWAANKDRLSGQSQVWRDAHKAEKYAYQVAYRAAHPELEKAWSKVKKARKRGAPVSDLTAAQWAAIKTAFGHRCVYCGATPKALTQDHVVPLSKGGCHTASNVVPACRSCNSRKHTGPPPKPVQPVLFT